MVEFPSEQERSYITAIGIAAVIVTDQGEFYVTRDVEGSARELGIEIVEAWWFKDRATATRVMAQAVGAGDTIAAEAARAGLRTAAHASVLERARKVAPLVDDALRAANRRGELAWFNRAFRARRLAGSKVSFGTAWTWLRRAVVRRLMVTGRVEYGPEMLAELFSTGNRGKPD